jgi:hypothetical protein
MVLNAIVKYEEIDEEIAEQMLEEQAKTSFIPRTQNNQEVSPYQET